MKNTSNTVKYNEDFIDAQEHRKHKVSNWKKAKTNTSYWKWVRQNMIKEGHKPNK